MVNQLKKNEAEIKIYPKKIFNLFRKELPIEKEEPYLFQLKY